EPYRNLRIALVELGDAAGDQPLAEPERRSYADGTARPAGKGRHRAFRFLHRLQNLLRPVIEDAAMLGWRQLPRRAVEQPDTQMLLQLLDAGGGDRRRDAHVPPRSRKAAQFHHAHENSDVV